MTTFSYATSESTGPKLGLVVLQADQTIEDEFRQIIPESCSLLVSRIPSGLAVTPESLQAMQSQLTSAAGLFPKGHRFDTVGYACTSGTAQIGAEIVAQNVKAGTLTENVSNPVSALVAACREMNIQKLAILSPYIEPVSRKLRDRLAHKQIETPIFGSFDESEEAKVAQISASSIADAARALVKGGGIDALFLSCTNLRTQDLVHPLAIEIGMPVLSSNLVLAWHMLRLSHAIAETTMPGDLLKP